MNGRKLRYMLGAAMLGALLGGAYAFVMYDRDNSFSAFIQPMTAKEPDWVRTSSEDTE